MLNLKSIKMKIKNKPELRLLSHFFLCAFVVATSLLMSCSDDPEPVNEEEVITTLTITLTPVGVGGDPVILEFFDEDGDGAIEPVYTYTPTTGGGSPAGILSASTTYNAVIELLNETETPAEDITVEILEEADEHLFCFTPGGTLNLVIESTDEDGEGLPVGIASSWVTGAASTGTVTVVLRHQPGVKTGDCPGDGDTDISVTFNIAIQE
jgi:hypothetical protein